MAALPTQHGLYCYSMYPVALYDTLGPDASAYIVGHAELPIVVSTLDKIPSLLSIAGSVPVLKVIVSMDSLNNGEGRAVVGWAKDKGIAVLEFGEIERIGAAAKRAHHPPKPEDILTIMYTSGGLLWIGGLVVTGGR